MYSREVVLGDSLTHEAGQPHQEPTFVVSGRSTTEHDAPSGDRVRFELDVNIHLHRLRVADEARRRHRVELLPGSSRGHFLDGRSALFDLPGGTPSIWGTEGQVLWAEGEAMILSGPTGVGKTTIAGQVVAGLVGVRDQVLGLPVTPAGKVLYIAADRPRQIRRALRRSFDETHQTIVRERLVFWEGPPQVDFAVSPEALVEMCDSIKADVVIIDSLKDVALGLAEDGVGASLNSAIQIAIAGGKQVLALHHQRKPQNGSKPNRLEDVYGSTWITAGAGSVVLLWGQLHRSQSFSEARSILHQEHPDTRALTTKCR